MADLALALAFINTGHTIYLIDGTFGSFLRTSSTRNFCFVSTFFPQGPHRSEFCSTLGRNLISLLLFASHLVQSRPL
ncbi:hypothetical protein AAZX31_17G148400 [Glycine max]